MTFQTEEKKSVKLKRAYFVLVLLFVYVLLFEFILPVNMVLPKPSILIETIPALFTEYDLLEAAAITTSVIYVSIIIAYLLVSIFAGLIIAGKQLMPQVISIIGIFRFIPAFFYAVLFAFWFPNSIVAEFFFAFIAAGVFLKIVLMQSVDKVGEEYISASTSLAITGKELYEKVIWKHAQPEVFNSLKQLHIYLWVLVLVYEFIGGTHGFGGVFNTALVYQDLSTIVLLAAITSLLIWFGEFLIKFFEKRIIYWEI